MTVDTMDSDTERNESALEDLSAWQRLNELPGGKKNPFEDPYGPTSDCFSSNDIGRMFRLGALHRDVSHLAACKDCPDRITKYSIATQHEMPQARAPRSVLNVFWRRPAKAILVAPKALMFIPSACSVSLEQGSAKSIRIEVLTPLKDDLRRMTVKLEGSVFGTAVSEWKVGDNGYPCFEFNNLQVSQEVLKGLADHNRFTEQVLFRIGESDQTRLSGTSNLEFKKA
jgi:hypothetical protein